MIYLLKVLLLLNGPLFLLICLSFLRKTKHINMTKDPLCKLGTIKGIGHIYNSSLIIFCVNQIVLVVLLQHYLQQPILFGLLISSTAGLLTGIITLDKHKKMHTHLAQVAFSITLIAGFIYGLSVFNQSQITGIISILAAIVISSSVINYLKVRHINAIQELIFFIGLAIWNTINIITILK